MPYSPSNNNSISQFTLGIKRWTRKCQSRLDTVTREVNLEIITKIIRRSPVDTGLFRGNWQVGIGSRPRGTLPNLDRSGAETIARISGVILGAKAGQRIHFTNNLPYALALEFGHSKQAPVGMVRVTIAEFHAITASAVAKTKQRVP